MRKVPCIAINGYLFSIPRAQSDILSCLQLELRHRSRFCPRDAILPHIEPEHDVCNSWTQ